MRIVYTLLWLVWAILTIILVISIIGLFFIWSNDEWFEMGDKFIKGMEENRT